MGWKDNISALLRYSLILAAINIPMLFAVTGWDLLSRRRWKQKQRRDDSDTEFQVLKCTSAAYQLLILPAALTVVIGVLLYQCAVDDPHELWDFWSRGGLKKYLLMLAGLDLLFIGCFLHSSWRKCPTPNICFGWSALGWPATPLGHRYAPSTSFRRKGGPG